MVRFYRPVGDIVLSWSVEVCSAASMSSEKGGSHASRNSVAGWQWPLRSAGGLMGQCDDAGVVATPASHSSCYSLGTMAQSKDWARRLIRELPKKKPADLLRSRSYAKPRFMSLFFEWLDERIYHDPKEALAWAKVAPALARKSPVAPGGRRKHRERTFRAFVALGSAYRACGDYSASGDAYRQALEIPAETVSELVRAEMDHRLSYLRACQGQADEALELANGAVETLRRVADETLLKLGQALISRGYVLASELGRHAEAIDAFGEALTLCGDTKASPADLRLHASACHNLAMAILESSSLADLSQARVYIQQSRKLLKGQKRSVARYRLLWVEALIWCKTGSHARAEKLFRMALEGFETLELPWEIALVGLDLAAMLHLCGEWAGVEKIAASTFQRFRLLAADTKAIAALSLWNDAVLARRWDEKKLAKARQLIAAGALSGELRNRKKP